jgi:hypothetical protein
MEPSLVGDRPPRSHIDWFYWLVTMLLHYTVVLIGYHTVACVFLSIEFACAPPNFVFPGSVASQWVYLHSASNILLTALALW